MKVNSNEHKQFQVKNQFLGHKHQTVQIFRVSNTIGSQTMTAVPMLFPKIMLPRILITINIYGITTTKQHAADQILNFLLLWNTALHNN